MSNLLWYPQGNSSYGFRGMGMDIPFFTYRIFVYLYTHRDVSFLRRAYRVLFRYLI
jgi:hypothetical protein